MGSDWTWSLDLPPLTPTAVSDLLDLATAAGLSPHRPDGRLNGFDADGEHRLVDRDELLHGLAAGTCSTNLWTRDEVDVHMSTNPLRLTLDAVNTWREPVPAARPFRVLHRMITDLWVAVADSMGAVFGRVEDEWSIEQIWTGDTRPEWLGWWTYFAAPPALPPELGATFRTTPGGGVVVALLDDPAAVDPVRFAELHRVYWAAW